MSLITVLRVRLFDSSFVCIPPPHVRNEIRILLYSLTGLFYYKNVKYSPSYLVRLAACGREVQWQKSNRILYLLYLFIYFCLLEPCVYVCKEKTQTVVFQVVHIVLLEEHWWIWMFGTRFGTQNMDTCSSWNLTQSELNGCVMLSTYSRGHTGPPVLTCMMMMRNTALEQHLALRCVVQVDGNI